MKPPSRAIVIASILLLVAGTVRSQELPVLDAGRAQLISQEISGDAAFEHIRFMTQFHRPRGGADGLWRVAEYVAENRKDTSA